MQRSQIHNQLSSLSECGFPYIERVLNREQSFEVKLIQKSDDLGTLSLIMKLAFMPKLNDEKKTLLKN